MNSDSSSDWEQSSASLYDESTTNSGETCGYLRQTPWSQYPVEGDEATGKSQNKERPGRKKEDATRIFSALRTKNNKPPKKEYVRCQIIRGIKKCIRHLLKRTMPSKGIHGFNPLDQEKFLIWRRMEGLVFANGDLFSNLGLTCEGPETDGKATRKRKQFETQFRSFSNKYSRNFYSQEAVRELHFLYLQLVYGTGSVNPEEMCTKLAVRCCKMGKHHSEKCRSTWESVRDYVMFRMIEQLDLIPFGFPQATSVEEPIQEFFEDLNFDDLFASPQKQDEVPTTS